MKTICVPKSVDAMNRLDLDSCIEGDLEELNLSQKEFDSLWDSGVFCALNRELSVVIDDFEDEKIVGELIGDAIIILESFIDSGKHPKDLFLKIRNLLILAKENNTGLFVFF